MGETALNALCFLAFCLFCGAVIAAERYSGGKGRALPALRTCAAALLLRA